MEGVALFISLALRQQGTTCTLLLHWERRLPSTSGVENRQKSFREHAFLMSVWSGTSWVTTWLNVGKFLWKWVRTHSWHQRDLPHHLLIKRQHFHPNLVGIINCYWHSFQVFLVYVRIVSQRFSENSVIFVHFSQKGEKKNARYRD